MWENNFGPATAIRVPGNVEPTDIINLLRGKFDAGIAGFTVSDIKNLGIEAANQGVDFSTLFLSLGFFIIISALILLSLSLSMHFETKKEQVSTYFALGFRNKTISGILFSETLMVSVAGAFAGTILAFFVNKLIIYALNSVWKGAVQTDTIIASVKLIPVLIGFISTILISIVLVLFKLRSFLKLLPGKSETVLSFHSSYLNKMLLISSLLISLALVSITFLIRNQSVLLSFSGGIFIFISSVLLIRQYYIGKNSDKGTKKARLYGISKQFYRFFPSHSVTPVIFISCRNFCCNYYKRQSTGFIG